ncbi:hypothetical protein [Halalkalibacterium ligniniphilum]|uniref:hypothetical protein n=1 Tax=Halalkalibacterium ligniniphilum TaxID=1134413 RepID=UPI00034C4F3D|nr:hypothetical protein [Halalkalibacterium ligniniphilum]
MSSVKDQQDPILRQLIFIVQQMKSDNPDIRLMALESLNQMVEWEINSGKKQSSQKVSAKFSPSHNRQTGEVMGKIRTLQKEKQSRLQKQRKWFSMLS